MDYLKAIGVVGGVIATFAFLIYAIISSALEEAEHARALDRSKRAECAKIGGHVTPSSEGWTCTFLPVERR